MALPPRAQKFRQDLPIVDPATGRPTNTFLRSINGSFDLLNYLADIQAQVEAAQAAAVAAQATADAAQATADEALAAGGGEALALSASFPSGLTISAVDVMAGTSSTINISAHSRTYATTPPTTVAVNAGSITMLAPNTRYFIYYDQASRLGGTVAYVETTTQADVAQVGDRHSVGVITTPVASGGPTTGAATTPPGGSYDEP